MLQEPPGGFPVKFLVCPSVIEAVVVVLSATTSQTGVTVNVTSSVVASQEPSAAIVYRILTVVFVLILAGVYVEPVIEPPPDTMLQEPPGGFPVKVFVCPSVIDAVVVVLSASASQIILNPKLLSQSIWPKDENVATSLLSVVKE